MLFKLGNNHTKTMISFEDGVIQLQGSYMSVAGLLLYVMSFIIFMIIVTRHNLTYIVPMLSGCLYAIIFLGAIFILKEKVYWHTAAGSLLIVIGVLIINYAK